MSIESAAKREVRVALSTKAQPVWFRFVKWAVLVVVSTLLWQGPYFWWWIIGSLGTGAAVHAIWRYRAALLLAKPRAIGTFRGTEAAVALGLLYHACGERERLTAFDATGQDGVGLGIDIRHVSAERSGVR